MLCMYAKYEVSSIKNANPSIKFEGIKLGAEVSKYDFFFKFYFSKLPQKRCQGVRRLHFQLPQSVYEEDEAEETAEKKD